MGARKQKAGRTIAGATLACALATAWAAAAQDEGEIVTRQYSDGGIYEGTFKNGKQDGHGTYKLPNGYEYSGEWVDGKIEGQGTARLVNGSVYTGHFTDGKPDGKGKIVFADGGT